MKQHEIDRLTLKERAIADTPDFFVKLRNIGLGFLCKDGNIRCKEWIIVLA